MINELEEKLCNINKKQNLVLGSFLAMGVTSFFISNQVGPQVFATGVVLPFLAINAINYYKFKIKKDFSLHSTIFSSSYEKTITKWFDFYISSSDNLTEQKYKCLFFSMWLKSRKLTSLPKQLFDKIEQLADKIIKTESQHDLLSLFYNTDKLSVTDFFEEDKDNKRKNDIAKKIYKDFEHLGLIGKHFNYWSTSEMLCLLPLQEYKLTNSDIKEINSLIKENNKTPDPFRNCLFFSDISMNYCSKIINSNPDKLDILKQFFNTMKQNSSMREIYNLIENTQKILANHKILDNSLVQKTYTKRLNKI